jgi:enoyl-CoA hydratase
MSYETLLVSIEQNIARVTLNRPEVLNALNAPMFDELEHAFREIAAREDVRVVLLTGAGDKAFAAGADIRELQELDVPGGERKARRGQEVFGLIEGCGKPVIALINGLRWAVDANSRWLVRYGSLLRVRSWVNRK